MAEVEKYILEGVVALLLAAGIPLLLKVNGLLSSLVNTNSAMTKMLETTVEAHHNNEKEHLSIVSALEHLTEEIRRMHDRLERLSDDRHKPP